MNSIWNSYSKFGSKYSDYSAFNEYAQKPPMIITGNEVMGYLTTNEYLPKGINPFVLIAFLKEMGY